MTDLKGVEEGCWGVVWLVLCIVLGMRRVCTFNMSLRKKAYMLRSDSWMQHRQALFWLALFSGSTTTTWKHCVETLHREDVGNRHYPLSDIIHNIAQKKKKGAA